MTTALRLDWDGPLGLPRFDAINDSDFAPAFDIALAAHQAEIAAIADNPDPATFENTILAMEGAASELNNVLSVFYNLAGSDSNDTRLALQRDFAPRLAAHNSDINNNRPLFDRVEGLWAARDGLGLDAQSARLLYLTRRGFIRAGAALDGAKADEMRQITGRLASLGTEFTQNLLADESGWQMTLAPEDLTGLPDFLVSAARRAGNGTPVITLSRSLIVPFLQFSPNRTLREKAYRAWAARGANGGETDNLDIVNETLGLREQRAKLLGYDSFAAFKLETEMAGTPERVRDLLMQVWAPAKAQADADAAVLTQMMQDDGINDTLAAWDWRYYAERRRQEEHALDEAKLKPYFQLDNMIAAAFDCATRLFGLEFRPLDAPLYHVDARAWQVLRNGEHMAIFIGDYFARPSKRSGAWCSTFQSQAEWPAPKRPIVVNVCNFAQPNDGEPALLSYDDARTLFHEFGHALHQILSNVRYGSMAGTAVARDFVELPSQLFEHWLEVPEVLEKFALHAETGQPMPQDMADAVLGAANFDMGFQTVEYLGSALVDLAFHTGTAPKDAMAEQARVLGALGMPAAIGMRHATPQFAHVFAGDGYASGYYSYMWSEVMDADAFEAFLEAGDPFDPATAQRLEQNILSVGGSDEPKDLYTAFRGRLPDVEALLKGRGLDAPAA